MRIGITAEFLGAKLCGTATYTQNLLLGLAQLDSEHRFFPYLSNKKALPLVPQAAGILPRLVPPYNAWMRIPLSLPADLVRHPVDLVHVQGWGPPWSPCPMVATIHDMSNVTSPELYPRWLRWRLNWLIHRTVRRSKLVIASCHHTARDLQRAYRVPPEQIRVVYPAIAQDLAPTTDRTELARVRTRYGLSQPYILYLGSIEPRKNVDQLIRAFVALRREQQIPHQLVIAGKCLWLSRPTLELTESLGLGQSIVFTGQVAPEDTAALYSGAEVFAYIAAYEGFGYPALEAMARGTPVLAANTASLPETVGEAAVLVDPFDEVQVARSLLRLLNDEGLRRTLVARGFEQVRQFEPSRQARQVVSVYEECLAQAGSS